GSTSAYCTVVATNSVGFSDPTPVLGFLPTVTAFNTFSIPGSNGSADADNDGLTNDQEIALGTDPLNLDTDGDGFQDGLEVLFVSLLNSKSSPRSSESSPVKSSISGAPGNTSMASNGQGSSEIAVNISSPQSGTRLVEGQTVVVAAKVQSDARVLQVVISVN